MAAWPRSFASANRRRGELISLRFQRALTEDEQREWLLLTRFVDAWVDHRAPFRAEVLRALVARLEAGEDVPAPRSCSDDWPPSC